MMEGKAAAGPNLPKKMQKQDWFTIKKVHSQVYALAEFNHWEKVVSYLFVDKSEAVLIDAGMGYGDILAAVRKITNLPVKLLLTHGHWDHVGGVGGFEEVFVFNNEFEKKLLEKGFDSEDIGGLNNQNLFTNGFKVRQYKMSGKKDYGLLYDKQEIVVGGLTVKVVHTPGHSPGSACFWVKKLGLLFVGDTIYPGPIYIHLPESNFSDYVASASKLQRLVTKDTVILPGHNSVKEKVGLLKRVNCGCKQIMAGELMADMVDQDVVEYLFKGFSILKKA